MKVSSVAKLSCPVILLVLSLVIAGCGGGGGGGDEGGSDNTVPEGIITYNAGNYWWSGIEQDLQIIKGDASATVWADLNGTYDSGTGIITADQDRSMRIYGNSLWNNYASSCVISVLDEMEMKEGEHPSKGKWEITLGNPSSKLKFNSLILEMDGSGVDIISYMNGTVVDDLPTLTWEQFESIENENEPNAYELLSWTCYSIWMLYYEIIFIEGNTITIFDDRFDDLASFKTIKVDGAVFPPNTGAAGSLGITWIDSTGDDALGYRDGFKCLFTNWWENDPDDDYGMLFNGKLNFMEYVGGEDGIGFNCIFDGFTIQETYNGVIEADSTLTLNGGFHLSESW